MPSVVESYLTACERLKYVLVIRLIEFTPPQLSLESKKFVSGRYQAEVLAFDLSDGALLGGFLVNADPVHSLRRCDHRPLDLHNKRGFRLADPEVPLGDLLAPPTM